jgi:hypothetical protein
MYVIQHGFICRPSDSTVSEEAGIDPMTDATAALAVRRSTYHSARSHQLYITRSQNIVVLSSVVDPDPQGYASFW